jgi:exopolysaccharide biosynthesis protein
MCLFCLKFRFLRAFGRFSGLLWAGLFWVSLLLGRPAFAQGEPSIARSEPAIRIEHFRFDGPVAGAVVRVDLRRARVRVLLADARDPDGDGPNVGLLDTPSQALARHGLEVALNASFFAVSAPRVHEGRRISYFVGNGARPVGWHVSGSRVLTTPVDAKLRHALVVRTDGTAAIREGLADMPADVAEAVSGNAIVLREGVVAADVLEQSRHPRSAVGLSADGHTLFLVAVDGRQDRVVPGACGGQDCPPHSRGVSLYELGALLKGFGAHTALNLDGGGSTALAAKDPATGAPVLINRPSDRTGLGLPVPMERAVVDVIGVTLR